MYLGRLVSMVTALLLMAALVVFVGVEGKTPQCHPCNCTQDASGKITANCSLLWLTYVPTNLPVNTSVLLLRGNPLTNLSDTAFANLTGLQGLDVSSCSLTANVNGSLTPLTRLEWLDVSHNPSLGLTGLTSLVRDLPGNSSLKTLNASKIVADLSLGVTVSVNLAKALQLLPLETLVLDDNQIEAVCDGVLEQLPLSLTTLSVRRNRFRPGLYMFFLQMLKNLTHLMAENQYSRYDPTSLLSGKPAGSSASASTDRSSGATDQAQTAASLSEASDPETTSYLLPLTEGVPGQEAAASPSDACGLFSTGRRPCRSASSVQITLALLRRVISGTFTFSLPPQLVFLNLSGNHLDFPLKNITIYAPRLKVLDLASNRFADLTGPIRGLEGLKYLYMSNNFALNLNPNFFSNFPRLQELDLRGNSLGLQHSLDEEAAFSRLEALQYLNLGRNYISKMAAKLFDGLKNVTALLLPLNNLHDWNVNISTMRKLSYLDLHRNSFVEIPKRLRDQLDVISQRKSKRFAFAFQQNRFECSCSCLEALRWLGNFVKNHDVRFQDPGNFTCSAPDGKTWRLGNSTDLSTAVDRLAKTCRNWNVVIGAVVGVVLLVVVVIVIGVLCYKCGKCKALQRGESEETRRLLQ